MSPFGEQAQKFLPDVVFVLRKVTEKGIGATGRSLIKRAILERRKTLWKLKRNILHSDSSPGMSLECSNLFSMSQKEFAKEADIGSLQQTLASWSCCRR